MPIAKEDLKNRRYVFIADKSGSMGEPAKKGNPQSRWNSVKETAVAVARKVEEIGGTFDLYTFNNSFQFHGGATADQVKNVFENEAPIGGTDFVPVMRDVFTRHFAANKPTIAFMVTDGQPSDGVHGQQAIAKLICDATQKMEGDGEFGVEFLQVGDDPEATMFLKKLDHDLEAAGAKFDVVNTKTCDELEHTTIEQVLLDAVND